MLVTSPCACVARSNSRRVSPGCARAMRRVRSTWIAFIRERSMTTPSSQTDRPAWLCPPERTATGSPCVRAKSIVRCDEASAQLEREFTQRLGIDCRSRRERRHPEKSWFGQRQQGNPHCFHQPPASRDYFADHESLPCHS